MNLGLDRILFYHYLKNSKKTNLYINSPIFKRIFSISDSQILWGTEYSPIQLNVKRNDKIVCIIKKSPVAFTILGEPSREDATAILKLSTPAAIERIIMRLGQVPYFGLIVKISADTFAAHSISGSFEMFAYMPGYGLAIAATTLVGQNVGANRSKEAYQYGMITSWIAVAFMSFIGLLFFFLSPWFASWFTSDTAAIDMVVTALRIDVL